MHVCVCVCVVKSSVYDSNQCVCVCAVKSSEYGSTIENHMHTHTHTHRVLLPDGPCLVILQGVLVCTGSVASIHTLP